MSRRQFLKEMEDGLPSPLYYLHAKDSFLVKDAVDRIGELVPEETREFNVMIYDAESAPPAHAVIDVLNTPGFFGDRKIVVMRNIQSMKKRELRLLLNYIDNPSSGSVFVMLSLKPPDKAMREKFKDAVRVVSLDMSPQEIRSWLRDVVRRKGVDITPAAVSLLMATSGTDMGVLYGEAEKACLLGKRRVDADDISELMHGSASYSVFSLVDALASGDKTKVFRIYSAVRDTLDPFAVLGAVNWKYSELSKKGALRKDGYFSEVFRCLAEADRRLKTSGGEYPLEELFVRLLRI
ncbi:MAG: DNA polymerase III subunit delta [Nitrospirae bacterium]|nr:DNA polymerase III subunit delta [Nitrospirota bacterium]